MSEVNPQGVEVHTFKQPSDEELGHDYLWRAVRCLPVRGKIALFNRSYYEDVLVVRVHQMQRGYRMPSRCVDMDDDEFFERRLKRISEFEEHLWENGYRVMKLFLNVSPEEQRLRFLERIDNPSKNWKFSEADITERAFWPKYREAYEDAIDRTATRHSPWYVIPADQKWFARWLVSEAVVDLLEEVDPPLPGTAQGPAREARPVPGEAREHVAQPQGKELPILWRGRGSCYPETDGPSHAVRTWRCDDGSDKA